MQSLEHKSEAEIQAVYAIQNFVHKLEHPKSMWQTDKKYPRNLRIVSDIR